ncbi:MAG: hypothetical protein HZY79_10305 [Rhodoblastus sp.]|nr:MAG: hypothetical protein HZY79_10305 [Rhodoblastus sp.]
MIRVALVIAALAASPAFAQSTASDAGSRGRPVINAQLVQLLQDGYDIKAAFAEGGPYVLLQKATSAYLCRGGGTATCEKLN